MEISKKAVGIAALAFGLLLPAAPAFAQQSSDDYTGGTPPCLPSDNGGMQQPGDDDCELPNDQEQCTPGVPTSGSGVDSDHNGTPDECEQEQCTPGVPTSGSGVDSDHNGTPDECEEGGGIDTGAPGGVDTGGSGEVGAGGAEQPGTATNGGAGAAEAEAPAAAAATAPSGSLPVTGGDVAGLALIGGAAIATGAVLVRRSRRNEGTTAA